MKSIDQETSHLDHEAPEEEFKIKKKVKKTFNDTISAPKIESNEFSQERVYLHPPKLNLVKTFYEILGLSNKSEDFLILLSNILTTGSRQLVNHF
jgi:hypothetical protein